VRNVPARRVFRSHVARAIVEVRVRNGLVRRLYHGLDVVVVVTDVAEASGVKSSSSCSANVETRLPRGGGMEVGHPTLFRFDDDDANPPRVR